MASLNVILSIKPEYCDKILQGSKTFEFRRRIFRKDTKIVYMYSTSPIQKIVGEFTIKSIHQGRPEDLWQMCKDKAGLNEKEFFDYFKGVKIGYAIEIGKVKEIKPREPKEIFKHFSPPQSFHYVSENESKGKQIGLL